MELKLGFLASGRGSNVKAILKSISNKTLDAEAMVVISNKQDAGVLKIAGQHGIPAYHISSKNFPKEFSSAEDALLQALKKHGVNLLILAGYLRPVGAKTLSAYRNRILNIHPALLPKYGGRGMYGLRVHEAVIESGDAESGATVHIVTQDYDKGRILAQVKVPRRKSDTPETLAARILREEHRLYSRVLSDIKSGRINLDE